MSSPVNSTPLKTNVDYWSRFAAENALKLQGKSGFGINVCQCCYLTGVAKNMFQKFKYMDNVEVYADMFEHAFGIQFPRTTWADCHICLVCVQKLRNAVDFKKQVLDTQDKFKDHLNQSYNLSEPVVIKDEPQTELEEIYKNSDSINRVNNEDNGIIKFNNDNNKYDDDNIENNDKKNGDDHNINDEAKKFEYDGDEVYTGDDNDSDWLPEESLPLKELKLTIKTETEEIKSTIEPQIVKPNKNSIEDNIVKKKNKKEFDTQTVNNTMKKKKNIERDIRAQILQTERLIDMKHNSVLLLKNSNACLYRYKFSKFECYRCRTFFIDFGELREHSKIHTWEEINKDINGNVLILYRKVDISDLKCNLCGINLTDLVELRSHLTESHNKKFKGHEDLLVPYRIMDKNFKCVICKEKYPNYCKLNIHTNQHFKSFICELCGAGFICEKNLNCHREKTHEKKKYKCKECKLEFNTEYFLRLHNKKVHDLEGIHVCKYCSERFDQHTKKMRHMIRVHGHKMNFHKCESCEKSFMTNSLLMSHIRHSHMKVKEFGCSYCDARFSVKQHLKVHIERHCCKNSES